ncbi:MAG: M14 family zinc carboxypeptidase [Candidatus Hydrogenedentes bacterium]|nr:M14 family zinc carboxypeptidase [Candidatus Hydrogenedentota bacterium]
MCCRWKSKLFLIAFNILLCYSFAVYSEDVLPKWYVVEVTIKGPADIDWLESKGFSVDTVYENFARVYVPVDELGVLYQKGMTPKIIGYDPMPLEKTPSGYHNYAELTVALQQLANNYTNLCRLISLGQSVQGREIWALRITDNPDIEEDEPEFKYVSTIHGDEPVGTELCYLFCKYLLENYNTDLRVTNIVNEVSTWIVPLMNPDGRESVSRYNANGYDLNRSFPDYPNELNGFYYDGANPYLEGRQPEVYHIMRWSMEHNFSLSANFHTGAVVVNYPYDDDGGPSGVEAPTPDDALMKWIATQYASRNPQMYNSTQFPGGITNGAQWYVVNGGMQDWNYRFLGCIEMTIELYKTKFPAGTFIPSIWNNNRESMLAYLECVLRGVRGLVYDRNTGYPVWGKVLVRNNSQPVFSHPRVGNYHRLLLPGEYDLVCTAEGYIPYRIFGILVMDGWATRWDVPLSNGDVNSDSAVNEEDLNLVIKGVLGLESESIADVDGNGASASDIQAIVNVMEGRPIGLF